MGMLIARNVGKRKASILMTDANENPFSTTNSVIRIEYPERMQRVRIAKKAMNAVKIF